MNSKDTRRLIKAISTKNLQGNWFRAFLVFLIMYLASSFIFGFFPISYPTQEQLISVAETSDYMAMLNLFLPATVTKKTVAAIGVVILLSLVVTCPMNIGMCRFFLRVAAGQKGEMTDFFSVFANLRLVLSSILLDLIIAVASAFWGVIFALIPIAIMLVLPLPAIIIELIALAAGIFSILWCSRYTFARYILAEGKHGAFKSFGLCLGLCKGRNKELMALRASYFLWDIVSIIPIFAFIYQILFGSVYARYLYHIRGDIKFVKREVQEENVPETEENREVE